ncbi:MAG: dicarboxylate/amino acid:cation symporter [Treponema sp.]|nr:dicarboxylate/amino acid:cation symporter [Treponema sp.]
MKTFKIENNINEVPKAVDFLRSELAKKKIPKKNILRTLLTAEDVITKMVENSTEKIKISVGVFLGNTEIRMSAKGTPFKSSKIEEKLLFKEESSDDIEANEAIRNMISKILGDKLAIRNDKGVNKVLIEVAKSQFRQLFFIIFALAAGIACGLAMQHFFPKTVSNTILANLFIPVYAMFMNTLKLIVAPRLFCSIASSIADFGDLKALGKLAVKIVICYLVTSLIAICIGLASYTAFPIGNTELVNAVTSSTVSTIAKSASDSISIKDTILGIVPTNIITPFENSEMLQLVFLAILFGLATSSISETYPMIKSIISALYALCSKITTVLVSFIPIVVFCSMAKMMISLDISNLLNVIVWVPVIYFGDILMIIAYMLFLFIVGGLNPLKFLGKFYPAMVSAFTFASSNASLPYSIKQADELGISKKVYSFSLPLGATVNMDGSCITLIITALFMAKIFSIPITSSILFSLFVAIMVLSVGSPGVSGGNLVCIALIIPQIGVPAEAVSLVLGLYPIVEMMQVCANVTGDAVVSTIVAKHENLLDLKKYNS